LGINPQLRPDDWGCWSVIPDALAGTTDLPKIQKIKNGITDARRPNFLIKVAG
jgi:hypothetical protein